MAASASSASGTPGPFHFQPPREFGGKKEFFEEFLASPTFKVVLTGQPRSGLVEMAPQLQWILVSFCSGPVPTCLRRESDEKLR